MFDYKVVNSALDISRLTDLIKRTLELAIKENLLTEECSCSGKTNEKQIKTRFTLEEIVPGE